MKNQNNSDPTELRRKAEEQLVRKLFKTDHPLLENEILKLNHELSVHQIELEMQNEELAFQLEEKDKLTSELIVANKELMMMNAEKTAQAAQLTLANEELIRQNEENEKRTLELLKKSDQLELYNSYFIGREIKMVELKKEINELLNKDGQEDKYLI